MRVCFFWFAEWPQARALLAEHAPDAELVYTGPDDLGYWRAIAERWTGERDLVVIEQDIGIHAGVVPGFAACGEPWCGFPHIMRPEHPARAKDLGCVRFSAELQRRVPMDVIVKHHMNPQCGVCQPDAGGLCWRHIDGPVNSALAAAGLADPHEHLPAVDHYHYLNAGG